MGTGSSHAESRAEPRTTAMDGRSTDEPDVASCIDCSVEDDQGQTAVSTTTDNTTAATQSQQEDTKQKTETEEEKNKREKREKQEQEYQKISVDLDQVWLEADETVNSNPPSLQPETQRTGWHTVRIFVSSTFRDFHTERDVLVKKVRTRSCFTCFFDN